MGGFLSRFSRKRKHSPDDSDSNSPKAKRIKLSGETSTHAANIAYESLFVQGRDSDIEVVIMNKTWKLHKSFLVQSPYFSKCLSNKSGMNKLTLSLPDNNITHESLKLCFGFLYGKPLDFLNDNNIDSVVATAIFLQLGVIVDKAIDYLISKANIKNAAKYFYLADKYELTDVCNHIYQRLLLTFIPTFKSMPSTSAKLYAFLREYKIDLLERLLKDPDILVVKDDFDLYQLMKKWVMAVLIQTNPEKVPESKVFGAKDGLCFLDLPKGKKFVSLFEIINLPVLFTNSRNYDILKAEKIIPTAWLEDALDKSWKTHITYYDYDKKEPTPVCSRDLLPVTRLRIQRNEKYFGEQPNRIFRRLSFPLNKRYMVTVLNGYTFCVQVTAEDTVVLKVSLKADVPHILIPTLVYFRFYIFNSKTLWNSEPTNQSNNDTKGESSNVQPAPENEANSADNRTVNSNNPDILNENNNVENNAEDDRIASVADHASSDEIVSNVSTASKNDSAAVEGNSSGASTTVFTQTDLFYVLPYPEMGITKDLYNLPTGYYASTIESSNNSGKKSSDSVLSMFMTIKFLPALEFKKEAK